MKELWSLLITALKILLFTTLEEVEARRLSQLQSSFIEKGNNKIPVGSSYSLQFLEDKP